LSVSRWIGVDEEASSPVKNWYKIGSLKLAAAAIEQLDFKVQHGDELKDVRLTPLVPPLIESMVKPVFVF